MANKRAAQIARGRSARAKWAGVKFSDNADPATRELPLGSSEPAKDTRKPVPAFVPKHLRPEGGGWNRESWKP